jgi:hypothetical protein
VEAYDLPDESITPRPYDELAADVRRISALGQAARLQQIGAELPGLLDELIAAIHGAAEADQPPLFALLAEAYSGASSIAGLLGYLDLRSQIVDRIKMGVRALGRPPADAPGQLAAHRLADVHRLLRPGHDPDGPRLRRPRRWTSPR